MPTIVLVLAYPTFVEIDLNEVRDTGNCNDEVQTIEYKSCSKRGISVASEQSRLNVFWGPGPAELMGPLPAPFPSFPPLSLSLPSPTLSSPPLRSRPLKSS